LEPSNVLVGHFVGQIRRTKPIFLYKLAESRLQAMEMQWFLRRELRRELQRVLPRHFVVYVRSPLGAGARRKPGVRGKALGALRGALVGETGERAGDALGTLWGALRAQRWLLCDLERPALWRFIVPGLFVHILHGMHRQKKMHHPGDS